MPPWTVGRGRERERAYPADVMINNLFRRKKRLRSDHHTPRWVKVGASENQLMRTRGGSSAISSCYNRAGRENQTGDTSLSVKKVSHKIR